MTEEEHVRPEHEGSNLPLTREAVYRYLQTAVYGLTGLLAMALVGIGTVAIIAELKGTWHWSIHLESTLSYGALVVSYLLAVLLPLFLSLVLLRRRWSDA